MEILGAGIWAALTAAAACIAEKRFIPSRISRDQTVQSVTAETAGEMPRWVILLACLWAAFCGAVATQNILVPVSMFRACAGFAVLAFIAVTDYLLLIIPNIASMVLILCQLAAIGWELMRGSEALPLLGGSVVAALICLALLGFLSLVSRNGIGMGDVKLLGALAFLCGLRAAFFTLLLGMLLCAGAAAFLLLTRKKKLKDSIPLGPALWAGYGISILLTLA